MRRAGILCEIQVAEWRCRTCYLMSKSLLPERIKDVKIHHIGIAVKNISEALRIYSLLVNTKNIQIEEIPADGIKIAFVEFGESKIELLEPLNSMSPVAKFLEKRGEGMHHIAIEVDNMEEKIMLLKKNGVRLIDENPRHGSEGLLVAFIHPESTGGVLIELCTRR